MADPSRGGGNHRRQQQQPQRQYPRRGQPDPPYPPPVGAGAHEEEEHEEDGEHRHGGPDHRKGLGSKLNKLFARHHPQQQHQQHPGGKKSPGEAAAAAAGSGEGSGSGGRGGFHLPHHLGFFPASPHLPFGLTHGAGATHGRSGHGRGPGPGHAGLMPPASPLASSAPAQLSVGPLSPSSPLQPPRAPGPVAQRLPPLSRTAAEALKVVIDHLGATALGVEGLYRVSGSKLEVDRLKLLLEVGAASVVAPAGAEALAAAFPDKHVVAGAVKKVLQEHEPLLTYDLYEPFLVVAMSSRPLQARAPLEATSAAAGAGGPDTSKEAAYRELVAMLPPLNRALLAHLLLHLKQVADMSPVNKMTPENLSMTVGVHLLRKSEAMVEGSSGGGGSGAAAQAAMQRLERERVVVTDLIRLAPSLFPGSSAGSSPPPRDGSIGGGGGSGGSGRVRSARLQGLPSSSFGSLSSSSSSSSSLSPTRPLSTRLSTGASGGGGVSGSGVGRATPPIHFLDLQREVMELQQARGSSLTLSVSSSQPQPQPPPAKPRRRYSTRSSSLQEAALPSRASASSSLTVTSWQEAQELRVVEDSEPPCCASPQAPAPPNLPGQVQPEEDQGSSRPVGVVAVSGREGDSPPTFEEG